MGYHTYERKFRFSAAHFNTRQAYEVVWKLLDTFAMDFEGLKYAFTQVHGHNFVVTALFENDALSDDGWLVDDPEIEAVVMQWAGINVSMHPDFLSNKERATTERMAQKLLEKFRALPNVRCAGVRVYETDDIFAEAF